MPITDIQIFSDFRELISKNHPQPSSVSSMPSSVKSMLSDFRHWLRHKKLSAVSVKNYLSDVHQFLHWSKPPSLVAIGYPLVANYVSHLDSLNSPRSTINRKLAALRQLGLFLETTYQLPNPAANLTNIPEDPIDNLIKNFHYHLRTRRHKSKTISNYLSDVKHYLSWATTLEISKK